MSGYAGRKVVVIGGTIGMGLAMARKVIAGGGEALVTGRNEKNLAEAASRLGPAAQVVKSDVAALEDIDALAATVRASYGQIDAVFINAGISELTPADQVTVESYDRQFNINARGAFFTAQRLTPLVRDGGSIVFTTMTPATASPTMAVYSGTKAAVRAFARTLAAELLPRRIRVNCVAPGFTDTPTLGIAGATAEERAAFVAIGDQVTPMKRHGSSEEVAAAALFLAFEATFTTGAELPVDGGLSQVDAPHE